MRAHYPLPPIALYSTVGTATQRAQTAPAVSSSSNTAASTVASSGNISIGQHVLGAAPVALGTVVGSIASISQPGLVQTPRQALAPSHAIQPSLLSQRLVLTPQAQARLPSKWPPLPLRTYPSPPSTSGTAEWTALD